MDYTISADFLVRFSLLTLNLQSYSFESFCLLLLRLSLSVVLAILEFQREERIIVNVTEETSRLIVNGKQN